MKKHLALFLGLTLAIGCGGEPEPATGDDTGGGEVVTAPADAGPADAGPADAGPADANGMWADGSSYTDGEIGLAGGTVFDILAPEPFANNPTEPGDTPNLPRAYETSPPRIPHGIADMDPITLDENLCVECHNGTDALATPKSHLKGTEGAEVALDLIGRRYNCTVCHVPQTDAKPLVGNAFAD